MQVHQLTTNFLGEFITAFDNGQDDKFNGREPILQVLSVKNMPARNGEPPRFRLIVSDGVNFMQSMLATQHNNLVDEGAINKNSIIKAKRFNASRVSGRASVLVILELEAIGQEADKIGDPKNMSEPGAGGAPASTSATAVNSTSTSSTAPSATLVDRPVTKAPAAARPQGSYPIYPIEQLSPYQNKWTIKARVTSKSDIRTYSTQRGEGKLFNVTFTDETGEIRATAFNANVDEFYSKLEEGKVYFISRAKVNIAKKKFGGMSNDFELGLEKHTEIEECHDTTNVPEVRYTFTELAKLDSTEKDAIIDVLGVVSNAGDLQEITSKAGKSLQKRDLTIVDRTQFSVKLTLWGRQAETFTASESPVIAFKGVKVGDFNGRSLSMVSSSTMQEHPNLPEANLLRGWYDSQGHNSSFQAQTSGGGGGGGTFRRNELMTLQTVKNSGIGQGDNADYFSSRCTIIFVKSDSVMYTACPGDKCSKKVTETSSGEWRCERCDRTYPEPEHRYLMSVHVADYTDQLWLQAFNDVGQAIIGVSAKELYELEQEDHAASQALIEKAHCKTFNFSCRAKQDTYNDQSRTRYNISRVWTMDYSAESRAILESLATY